MRRILTIISAILMFSAFMTGCSNSKVTLTLADKYKNTIADEMSAAISTDDSGNTVYTFSNEQYLAYIKQLKKKVKSDFRELLVDTATYSYLNEDGTELVVGVDSTVYNESECKKQAQKIGEIALMYNASTLEHTGKVTVVYEDCYTGKEFFSSKIEEVKL